MDLSNEGLQSTVTKTSITFNGIVFCNYSAPLSMVAANPVEDFINKTEITITHLRII